MVSRSTEAMNHPRYPIPPDPEQQRTIEEASRTAMSYLNSRHVDYTRGSLTTHLNNQIARLENELTQTRIIVMRLNGQIASLESELAQARDVTRDLDDQIASLENELAQARSIAYSANIRFNEQTVRLNDKLAHALHVGSNFRARFEDAGETVRELREELERQQAAAARCRQEFEMLAAAAQLASMNDGGLSGTTTGHLDSRVEGFTTGLDTRESLPASMPVPGEGFEGEDGFAGGLDNNDNKSPATAPVASHQSIESPSPSSGFRAPDWEKKRKVGAAGAISRGPSPRPPRQRRIWEDNEQSFVSHEDARGGADDPFATDPMSPIQRDCDTPTTKSDDQTYIPSDHSAFEWDSDSASQADDSDLVSDFDDNSEPAQASSATRSSAPSPRSSPAIPISLTPSSPTPPSSTPPAAANAPASPKTRRYARSRQTVRRFAVGTVPGIQFEFTRKARTVTDIYREWYVGTPSSRGGIANPPIAALEREHGTAWRSNPDDKESMKYSSNYVSVRRLVVEFVDREVERRRADWAAAGMGKGEEEEVEAFEAEDVCRELDAVVRGKIQKLTECLRAKRDPFEEFGG